MKLSTLKTNARSILETPIGWEELGVGLMITLLILSSCVVVYFLALAISAKVEVALIIVGVLLLTVLVTKYAAWKWDGN